MEEPIVDYTSPALKQASQHVKSLSTALNTLDQQLKRLKN